MARLGKQLSGTLKLGKKMQSFSRATSGIMNIPMIESLLHVQVLISWAWHRVVSLAVAIFPDFPTLSHVTPKG